MLWYVIDGETKQGPYGATDIREMLREGIVSLETMVVREGSPLRRRILDVLEELTAEAASATLSEAKGRPPAAARAPVPDQATSPLTAGVRSSSPAPEPRVDPHPVGKNGSETVVAFDPFQPRTVRSSGGNSRSSAAKLGPRAVSPAPSPASGASRSSGPLALSPIDKDAQTVIHRATSTDGGAARAIGPAAHAQAFDTNSETVVHRGALDAGATRVLGAAVRRGGLASAAPPAPAPAPAPVARQPAAELELERLRAENELLRRQKEQIEREKEASVRAAFVAVEPPTDLVAAARGGRLVVASPLEVDPPAPAPAPAPEPARGPALAAFVEPEKGNRTGQERAEKQRPAKEEPEHQRPRAASEGRLRSEKIRWRSNRVNATSAGDSVFEAPTAAAPAAGAKAVARPRASSKAKKAGNPNLTYIIGGAVTLLLVVVIAVAASKRSGRGREGAGHESWRDAERVANEAIRKADAERARAAAERRQAQELKRAREQARLDAKREALAARAEKERELRDKLDDERARARAAEDALAGATRKLSRAERLAREKKARQAASWERKKREAAAREQARKNSRKESSGGGGGGPPAPGWPSKILHSRAQLRASPFQLASVTGIRVAALPSAGCSPCQVRGTLSDGTAVTLVAPTFTPFVPAKMSSATRVAVKGIVQPKPDGSVWIIVQSAIKD